MRFGSFPKGADFIIPLTPNPLPEVGQGKAQHCKDFGVYSYPFRKALLTKGSRLLSTTLSYEKTLGTSCPTGPILKILIITVCYLGIG